MTIKGNKQTSEKILWNIGTLLCCPDILGWVKGKGFRVECGLSRDVGILSKWSEIKRISDIEF